MPFFPTHIKASALAMSPFPIREVSGHRVMDLPGGVFAMGTGFKNGFKDTLPPRLVKIDAFSIGVTPVSAGKFRHSNNLISEPLLRGLHSLAIANVLEDDQPAQTSWRSAVDYVGRLGLGLPTEAEYEYAARGPAINMRYFMEEIGLVSAAQLIEFLNEEDIFLENAVDTTEGLMLGANLVTDINSPEFEVLVNSSRSFVMWRGYNTLSGRSPKWEQNLDYKRYGAPVDEGRRRNAYGLSDMEGGVPEWCADVYDKFAHISLSPLNPFNAPFDSPFRTELNQYRVVRSYASTNKEEDKASRWYSNCREKKHALDFCSGTPTGITFRVAATHPDLR